MDDGFWQLSPGERSRVTREIGEGLWRQNKAEEARIQREEMINSSRQPVYWPFGRPGGGAPNMHSTRRQNLGSILPHIKEDEQVPNLPCVKRRIKFSDPELRFQFQPDVRRSVDIHWRYRLPPVIKNAYRMELERQIEEKRQRKTDEWRMRRGVQQAQEGLATEFGRPGPGGQQWRNPSRVGMNFLHSLGWTGEKAFRRLEDQLEGRIPKQLMIKEKPHDYASSTPEDQLTGGVELVPLMARRRSFKKTSHLPSCDVTNAAAFHHGKETWQDTPDPIHYLKDLNTQVNDKRGQAKVEREEDARTARKHFETWNSLWGRPGHGAPRAGGVKGKGHLGRLLYRDPGVLWPASNVQKVR